MDYIHSDLPADIVLVRAADHMAKVGRAEGIYFDYDRDKYGDFSRVPISVIERSPCCMLGATHLAVFEVAKVGSLYKNILGPIPRHILGQIHAAIKDITGKPLRIPQYSDTHSLEECVYILRRASELTPF